MEIMQRYFYYKFCRLYQTHYFNRKSKDLAKYFLHASAMKKQKSSIMFKRHRRTDNPKASVSLKVLARSQQKHKAVIVSSVLMRIVQS